MKYFVLIAFVSLSLATNAQTLDSLKREILLLREDVNQIQLNLETSQAKFKRGIAVATLGYSVTIAGGLMLGRKNDELGKVLLVGGGATGITGTILMVDAFRFLSRKKKPK
jgi:hypothetical protein